MKLPWLTNRDEILATQALPAPDTAAFRDWYRDSKVEGVVYHGTRTPVKFNVFAVSPKSKSGDLNAYLGPHFTEDPRVAMMFMRGSAWHDPSKDDVPRVYPVYLAIENPSVYYDEASLYDDIVHCALLDGYRVSRGRLRDLAFDGFCTDNGIPEHLCDTDEMWHEIQNSEGMLLALYKAWADALTETERYEELRKMASAGRRGFLALGYDGVKYTNVEEGGETWVTLQPNQIKSAIANIGNFSLGSDDVRRNP